MDREQLPTLIQEWIDNLWGGEDKHAYYYLTDQRAIEPHFIEKYHLGWTANADHFRDCISIPYLTGTGKLRGVRFRRLEGSPKYDHIKGEKLHLFNVSSVKHNRVYLTEGEFDAIILEQLGFPAVGIPGVATFKDEWKWLFIGNDVRIVFDGDKAGQDAARRVGHTLKRVVEDLEIVEMPTDHDVTSLFKAEPEILRELLLAYE